MLDSRVYRAAFLPVLLGVILAAFALAERPRPIGTTLAPEAFDGRRAFATLRELAERHPDRRPGSAGDAALAEEVAAELQRAGFDPVQHRFDGETADGGRTLTTVVGERPGRESRRIVILADRDAAARGAPGRLSGTAALVELVRLYRGRATRRTLTFVSTSGASGGLAGARRVLDQLGDPIDAVLVLGDMASRQLEPPLVVPWSDDGGMAPLRLRRTVEEAVRIETGADPGMPRALGQVARIAVPLTLAAQGPLNARGVPAVTLSASGERGADPSAAVSQARLESFGRAALRSISALDNGPDIVAEPRPYLVVQRRLLPEWPVRLLAGLLLLPALVASVDGLARLRRRGAPVAPWLRWLLAAALPFLAAALLARLLGLVGLLPSPPGLIDPEALPVQLPGLIAVALVLLLGLVVRKPVAAALGAPRTVPEGDAPGPAAAIGVTLTALALAVWIANAYTALLLVPAVHLWLLAAVPEVRWPPVAGLLLAALGLLPLALVAAYYAAEVGLDPLELVWAGVVVVSSGYAGPLGVLAWSGILACGLGAAIVATRKRRSPRGGGAPGEPADVSIRGPLSYAGPGSLGGTESALRR